MNIKLAIAECLRILRVKKNEHTEEYLEFLLRVVNLPKVAFDKHIGRVMQIHGDLMEKKECMPG